MKTSKLAYNTSLGPIIIECTKNGISGIRFVDKLEYGSNVNYIYCKKQASWIKIVVSYFNTPQIREKEINRNVNILPIDIKQTEFQNLVWCEIGDIPLGETRTYKQIAEAIGKPKSYRAVANACSANPIPLIIPCHRVIRENGELGGYNGGVWRKLELLRREGAT